MKIFSWMRTKLNGKESNKKSNQEPWPHHMEQHQSCKEEFSDWPNDLLAIGTFGNDNLKHNSEKNTTEEFEEVDKELRLLLNKHMICVDSEKHNPVVDKLLECLREDEKNNEVISSVVPKGGKDIKLDNKRSGIGKKSLSFLLKKALLCRDGFSTAPMLRDPLLPDPRLDNSRMDKVLRAMLHKKIYPQRSTPKTTSNKYLDNMVDQAHSDQEECEKGSQKSKWVKTDSEYIVLEI